MSLVDAMIDWMAPSSPEPALKPVVLSETEKSQLSDQEAQRKRKKQASGTKTTLTAPLGGSTPATAITKLGGS